MLAPAFSALDVPLPPEIPRIVEEPQWLSRLGVKAEELTRARGDQYENVTADWLIRLHDLQRTWQENLGDLPPPTEQEADDLAGLIEQAELVADHRVRRRAALLKRGGSSIERLLDVDPGVAAVHRAFNDRLVAIEDRIIEAVLDHALFLRAIRADLSGEARGGPTFSDPADLRRYLKDVLAA